MLTKMMMGDSSAITPRMVLPSKSADSHVSPTAGLPIGTFIYSLACMVHHTMAYDPRAIEALRELGVRVPEEIDALLREPTFEAAKAKLAELKERVRKNFRKLAFELHPDRTGGDPGKTERFKLLVQVQDSFDKLQIRPPQPRVMHVVWHNPMAHTTNTAASTSVYTQFYQGTGAATPSPRVSPLRVVFMRPI